MSFFPIRFIDFLSNEAAFTRCLQPARYKQAPDRVIISQPFDPAIVPDKQIDDKPPAIFKREYGPGSAFRYDSSPYDYASRAILLVNVVDSS
jgi:hypothetical protein